MYGRYGVDQLYKALFGVMLVFLLTNVFLQSSVLDGLVWAILLLASYRVFSKNIYKRQRENTQYLQLEKKIRKEFKLINQRVKLVQTHRFRKCPKCHQVLRLKRKPGKHNTLCPKCQTAFTVNIIL